MKYPLWPFALAALLSISTVGLVWAGATSNEGGPQAIGGGAPQQGAAGIPQKSSEEPTRSDTQSADEDHGEDVSVDRDPAPRVPKIDKP